MTSTMSFRLSQEDQETFDRQACNYRSTVAGGADPQADMRDLANLLSVTHEQLESVEHKAWFQKAWLTVSGERGKLRSDKQRYLSSRRR